MVTRAGSVPQVHLSAGPVQLGREGGEDQGMGEGSEARGEKDCCSMVWFEKVLADSLLSWYNAPWLPDQGGGGIVWLPDQRGEQGIVWLPDQEGRQETVWLPDEEGRQGIGEEAGGIWLPEQLDRGKAWLPNFPLPSPSSLFTRRRFLTSLGGGSGVLGLVNWSIPL